MNALRYVFSLLNTWPGTATFPKLYVAYALRYAMHAPKNAKLLKTIIARNALKFAANALKNAGKWPGKLILTFYPQ